MYRVTKDGIKITHSKLNRIYHWFDFLKETIELDKNLTLQQLLLMMTTGEDPVFDIPNSELFMRLFNYQSIKEYIDIVHKTRLLKPKRDGYINIRFDQSYFGDYLDNSHLLDVDLRIGKKKKPYALASKSFKELLSYPVKLDPKQYIFDDIETKIFDSYTYCFFNVIDSLMYEITYHGSPSETKEFIEDLHVMAADAKKHPENLILFKPGLTD